MKSIRPLFWFVLILFLFALLIDWPTVPVKFTIGSYTYDKVLKGPNLNELTNGKVNKTFDVRLGLDLKGGTYISLRGDMSNVVEGERKDKIEATKEVIKNRIDQFGTSESNIYTSVVGDEYRIVVELPGTGSDVEQQIDTIKQVAKLEFWERKSEAEIAAIQTETVDFTNYLPLYYNPTDVTGADLKDAKARQDQNTGKGYEVVLEFTDQGAEKFNAVAIRNRGKDVAIVLDGQIISDPIVQEDFGLQSGTSKFVTITGGANGFEEATAENLAIQLRGGALPIPVEVIQQRTIEPTLGKDSLSKSLIAGVVGIILIMLFMIFLYRGAGLIADIALILYMIFTLALFKAIPITLTLAGIAGFILSIGMAVDANVLIFERMLEELRKGKSKAHAIKLGFERAWTSIRDSNFSTLITCAILYMFGSGIVRGFAITLAVGVLVSLFTAVTITRMLLDSFYRKK